MNLKSVCLLLSLCHAGSAAALGLGDISVRSYLGQPLHATVTLLGATPDTTSDCFSLDANTGSIAPPLRARLSVERSGNQAILHIRTPQAIHDPVAQFVLVSDCEARLKREYVVLLDPPALAEPDTRRDAPTAAARPLAAPASPAASRSPHRVKPAVTPRPSATTARQAAATRARPAPAVDAPRLVLSGKHGVPRDTSFALRLDTNLPDLTRPRPENLTATELSDENTALTRKLAHLEAQLAALRLRNAELDARRTAATTVAPPLAGQAAHWPWYLLALGLLAGGGGLAVWLRRRDRHPAPGPGDMWSHLDIPSALPEITPSTATAATPAAEPMRDIIQSTAGESTEVKDDILDQAEVYMAHGHGDLAAHLLQEHLRDAPTESPVPWLLLLDLLHRAGDTAGYAAASAECRRYFNVNLSNHPVSQDSESGQSLEDYPHLLEQLTHRWNSPDIDSFFNELIYDHRGGTRIGFEPGAYREILLLRAIALEALPRAA